MDTSDTINKDYILKYLQDNKKALKKNYGVISIGLFGSYARNTQNSSSDIDIAVTLENINKFKKYFALRRYLESIFHKQIDLVIENKIKPILIKRVKDSITYV